MFTVGDLKVIKRALETEGEFLRGMERHGVYPTGQEQDVSQVKAKIALALEDFAKKEREASDGKCVPPPDVKVPEKK